MTNNPLSPKVWVPVVVVAAAAVGYLTWSKTQPEVPAQNQPSAVADATKNWKTYSNAKYGFEFKYPAEYVAQQPQIYTLPAPLVRFDMPPGLYPKTNFDEAGITVGIDDTNDAIANCYVSADVSKTGFGDPKSINGIPFREQDVNGIAAGNFYDSQVYRTNRGKICYEVVLTVHTGNISNYPPGLVTAVDENQIFATLDRLLNTFKFTK